MCLGRCWQGRNQGVTVDAFWTVNQGPSRFPHWITRIVLEAIHPYRSPSIKRTKADRADATLIAQFCRDLKPNPWPPSSADIQAL